MSASLISPSGTVLLRRVRCSTQPGPDPLAMPVLITLVSERHPSHGAPSQPGAGEHVPAAEVDLAG